MTRESKWIDISYPIYEGMSIYPENPRFEIEWVQDVKKGNRTRVSRFSMESHTGTHIDVPFHFIRGGISLDQIPLERMNGNARVVDATGYEVIDIEFVKSLSLNSEEIGNLRQIIQSFGVAIEYLRIM